MNISYYEKQIVLLNIKFDYKSRTAEIKYNAGESDQIWYIGFDMIKEHNLINVEGFKELLPENFAANNKCSEIGKSVFNEILSLKEQKK